jgi:membrane protease YdiL (CAAX protease family)
VIESPGSLEQLPVSIESPGEVSKAPSKLGRWLLVGTLLFTYFPVQLVLALPYVLVVTVLSETPMTYDELLSDPSFSWAALLAAAGAALITIIAALLWPKLWQRLSSTFAPFADWLSWRKPRIIPLWVIPVGAIGVMMIIGYGVSELVGPTDVAVQQQLFSTQGLTIASLIVVTTVVPLAEELVFRGAIYNAFLSIVPQDRPAWLRHILPFIASSILFAAAHLLAGFDTPGAIVGIFLLSFFLTALRTVTGSVQSGFLAHLVWNGIAAVGAAMMP